MRGKGGETGEHIVTPLVTLSQTCHTLPYSHIFARVLRLAPLSGKPLFFQGSSYVSAFPHSKQNCLFLHFVPLAPNVPVGSGFKWIVDTFEKKHKTSQKDTDFTFSGSFRGYLGSLRSLPWIPDSFQLHSSFGGAGVEHCLINKCLELQIYNFHICETSVIVRKIQIIIFILPV